MAGEIGGEMAGCFVWFAGLGWCLSQDCVVGVREGGSLK